MFEGITKKDAVAKENRVIRKNPRVFHNNSRKDKFTESRISIRPYPLQAHSSNSINSFQRPSFAKRDLGYLAPLSCLLNYFKVHMEDTQRWLQSMLNWAHVFSSHWP